MVASSVCLPPAGSGACVPLGSAPGITLLTLLVVSLLGIVLAGLTIIRRYLAGERDIGALLGRPIQHLVSAGVTCLIGVAMLGLLLSPR